MDPKKTQAINDWSEPKTQKQVRSFMGLTGYYCRFICWYATIAAPLTNLLQKEGFHWETCEQQAFMVKADVSGVGIGVILLQQGQPISYFSQKLGPRMIVDATYQKERYVIVEAVYKWRQYLWAALSYTYGS